MAAVYFWSAGEVRMWPSLTPWWKQGSQDPVGLPAHPKGPEAKDDDDEVDHVSHEHVGVDVGGCMVLCVQDVPEEVAHWLVNLPCPAGTGDTGPR